MTQSSQAWQEKKIPVYDDGPNHTAKIPADFIMKKEVKKAWPVQMYHQTWIKQKSFVLF